MTDYLDLIVQNLEDTCNGTKSTSEPIEQCLQIQRLSQIKPAKNGSGIFSLISTEAVSNSSKSVYKSFFCCDPLSKDAWHYHMLQSLFLYGTHCDISVSLGGPQTSSPYSLLPGWRKS